MVGGRVYIGSLDGKLYALDEATGEEFWSTYLSGAIRFSSPAVGHGRVYVATYKTYPNCGLHCLDAQTGEHLWFQNIACTDSPPAVADGLVYIGAGKYVHAFDAYTGANTWSCQLMEARAERFLSSGDGGYPWQAAVTDAQSLRCLFEAHRWLACAPIAKTGLVARPCEMLKNLRASQLLLVIEVTDAIVPLKREWQGFTRF